MQVNIEGLPPCVSWVIRPPVLHHQSTAPIQAFLQLPRISLGRPIWISTPLHYGFGSFRLGRFWEPKHRSLKSVDILLDVVRRGQRNFRLDVVNIDDALECVRSLEADLLFEALLR